MEDKEDLIINESDNKNDGEKQSIKIIKDNYRLKFYTLLAFLVVFSVGFILFGWLYADSNLKMNGYGNTLEASYERAVYDLADNVNNIEVNLSKAQISTDLKLQRKYMQLVCDNCKYAQSNFEILPINLSATREGVAFINKMDGYCTSLISAGNNLNDAQKAKLAELYNITLELKTALNNLMEKIMKGYNILSASEKDLGQLDDFSSNFDSINADSVSYPSMIFDGPFSDSLLNKEIKGLVEIEVDKQTAQDNLDSILRETYTYDEIVFVGETNGDFKTYDFEVKVSDGTTINASVAKRGGFLINLSGFIDESEDANVSMEDCIANATNFCGIAGASNMGSVWTDSQKGIAFINLAPIIDNIIYYPDLIKVKVDMKTGKIVGYDAQSYAYNHTNRIIQPPTVSPANARDLIDIRLNINSQKLCVIPLDYGGEQVTYEFYCEYYGEEYYIYINAYNGQEERVMKVVSTTEQGALTK